MAWQYVGLPRTFQQYTTDPTMIRRVPFLASVKDTPLRHLACRVRPPGH